MLWVLVVLLQSAAMADVAETLEALENVADEAEHEAKNKGYNWPMMDLDLLETNTFLPSLDEHELSVVVFHTKFASEWPLVRAILKTAKANFTEKYPDRDIQWASVDLDKSPRLSTYSHFNMIDVMYFYPDLSLFPIRVQANLSVSSVLNETEFMWQYTNEALGSWDTIDQVVNTFVSANFKGKGDPEEALERAETFFRRSAAYMQLIMDVREDQSELAARSNDKKRAMMHWQSRFDPPMQFLQDKEESFMVDQFLQYAFPEGKFKKRMKTRQQQKRKENKKPLMPEKRVEKAPEEELM